ncbi:Zinc/iron permease [Testicularia cyperi]|uniref:Zinc/iron permease n=1 Tax=Testicularia cyperi TaxID=1882483 RepID=A0A317XGB4_9BASI|nr:Zinc/iron permease [Testicularia cyperi]
MQDFLAFALLVTGMGVGTLLCGLLPLSLPLSRRMMRVLEVFGAGLLVGAAVTVVIPEGANALFKSATPANAIAPLHAVLGGSANVRSVYNAHTSTAAVSSRPADITAASSDSSDSIPLPAGGQQQDWAWSFMHKRDDIPTPPRDADHDHDHAEPHEHHGTQGSTFTQEQAESRLGTSIVVGIVLMYVIDQFTSSALGGHGHDHDTPASRSDSPYPSRPRLESHRLSKSFHHKHRTLSARPSFTIFDSSAHADFGDDETQNPNAKAEPLPEANAADARDLEEGAPHKRFDSTITTASSEASLPDDYDDDIEAATAKRQATPDWNPSMRSSMTLPSDAAHQDSSSPLLQRQGSHASLAHLRPHPRRSASSASIQTSFGQALTTIVGLLIHAAADGIAMGASSASGDQALTMVVFVAIMVHKAPAAFGLCTMLMSQRLSRASVRKGVGVFSIAAPAGALITYVLLVFVFNPYTAQTAGSAESGGINAKHVGTALAFSGGTFLFVAFHAVLELAGVEADTVSSATNDGSDVQILGKYLRVILLIAGAWTPRLLQSLLKAAGVAAHQH